MFSPSTCTLRSGRISNFFVTELQIQRNYTKTFHHYSCPLQITHFMPTISPICLCSIFKIGKLVWIMDNLHPKSLSELFPQSPCASASSRVANVFDIILLLLFKCIYTQDSYFHLCICGHLCPTLLRPHGL